MADWYVAVIEIEESRLFDTLRDNGEDDECPDGDRRVAEQGRIQNACVMCALPTCNVSLTMIGVVHLYALSLRGHEIGRNTKVTTKVPCVNDQERRP